MPSQAAGAWVPVGRLLGRVGRGAGRFGEDV